MAAAQKITTFQVYWSILYQKSVSEPLKKEAFRKIMNEKGIFFSR